MTPTKYNQQAAYGDIYALATASGRAGSEEDSEGESEGQEHETQEQTGKRPHAAFQEELELDSMMPRSRKKQDEEDKNYSPRIFRTSPLSF